ncbi:Asparagine synthase [Penicillium expansum]|nr:Asparagine synthase [Penicillium expansum]
MRQKAFTEISRKEHVKLGNEETSRVTCFSVAFLETSGYDKSHVAERTAEWLRVKTIKKIITEDALAEDFEDAVFHCEHHHYDLNSVAKFALSTLPQEHGTKVVLTGEGSYEHFASYPCFPVEFLREADGASPDSELGKNGELRENLFKSAQ